MKKKINNQAAKGELKSIKEFYDLIYNVKCLTPGVKKKKTLKADNPEWTKREMTREGLYE